MYYVTVCSQCGRYMLAKEDQKTRICTYCGARVSLANSRRIATARTAQEASETIRTLKSRGKNNF